MNSDFCAEDGCISRFGLVWYDIHWDRTSEEMRGEMRHCVIRWKSQRDCVVLLPYFPDAGAYLFRPRSLTERISNHPMDTMFATHLSSRPM